MADSGAAAARENPLFGFAFFLAPHGPREHDGADRL